MFVDPDVSAAFVTRWRLSYVYVVLAPAVMPCSLVDVRDWMFSRSSAFAVDPPTPYEYAMSTDAVAPAWSWTVSDR